MKTKRNGLEWKEAFIKYVCRVLKSFPMPNLNSTQNDLSNEVMLEEIERKLRWIKSEIQPDFSRRIKKTNGVREVTQEKLTDLWNTNRARAIAIIKDDCKIDPRRVVQFKSANYKNILRVNANPNSRANSHRKLRGQKKLNLHSPNHYHQQNHLQYKRL